MIKVRRVLAIVSVLALGVGVVACGSDSDSDSDSGSKIEGVTWTAMNLATAGAATSLPQGTKPPTLAINDGQATIFGGCNNGSGEAEVSDTTIDFGPIAMTKKSCGLVQNQIEFLVKKVLQGEVKYEVNSDGNLVVEKGTNSIVYTPG